MNSEKMIEELVRDEGLRFRPYADSVGKLTIGIGRNLIDVGISKEEAYHLLNNDLEKIQADLDQLLSWWRGLDEVRQRVLVNMAFNLGIHGLLEFRHTLGMVQSGAYQEAASAMLESVWAKQVGPRAVRLSNMMRDGDVT